MSKIIFSLDENEVKELKQWREEQDKEVVRMQKEQAEKNGTKPREYAYYGTCGGEITFTVTPTGLGTSIEVEHHVTKSKLTLRTLG